MSQRERIHTTPDDDRAGNRRDGDHYLVTEEEKAFFMKNGYLVLRNVVSQEELAAIDEAFTTFANGGVSGMGKDFCDMSGGLNKRPEDFTLVNAMLPRVYLPSFANNIFERRANNIARALLGKDMALDYDQFLAKKPGKSGAVFAWHQDMAYWPKKTPDTRTVTCSLALDDADLENGCLRVIPGSHTEGVRKHRPLAQDLAQVGETTNTTREDAHAQVLDLKPDDEIVYLPVRRGDITLHNEWIIHGSGGNNSKTRWRRTYVIAFRSEQTIAQERKIGFTHSHNDKVNWDTFDQVEGA